MSNKTQILRLYKELLRESSKFKLYYYRNYFIRKTRNLFKKQIGADEETGKKLFQESQELLVILRRQTMVTNAFEQPKLVIEEPAD